MEAAAILTIKRADEMTEQGRREVAAWLKQAAEHLVEHGENYQKLFTARYWYAGEK